MWRRWRAGARTGGAQCRVPTLRGDPRARGAGSALAAAQAAQAAGLAPLLALVAATVQRAGLAGLALAKGSAKLGYVAAALLAGAVEQGFCTAAAEEAGGGADGGAGAFQEAEGTVRRPRPSRAALLPPGAPWAQRAPARAWSCLSGLVAATPRTLHVPVLNTFTS